MSITQRIIAVIVALSALTVIAPGHAETPTEEGQQSLVARLLDRVSHKDVECLARNIFYEAGNEPEEGKVAVGLVTVNRVLAGMGKNICAVVHSKVERTHTHEIAETRVEDRGWFRKPVEIVETHIETYKTAICQFTWACLGTRPIKKTDQRWVESQRVAQGIVNGDYPEYEEKYEGAKYFHNNRVKPDWAHQKQRIDHVGGHFFYKDKQ